MFQAAIENAAKKIKSVFPSVVLYRSSFMPGGDGTTWKSNDPNAIVEFRNPVIKARKGRATDHRLPDQVIEASHFINLPIIAEIPTDWKTVSDSLNKQQPFVIGSPQSPVSRAVEALANGLVTQQRK